MTARLVSVGNAIVDLVFAVPRLPERGGDVLGHSHGLQPGGAVNVLVAARRHGLAAAYAGVHGTGPLGDLVRAACAAEGIEILVPIDASLDTGVDVVFTEPNGERSFATAFGAEAHARADALAKVRITADDFVHISGYGLLDETNGAVLAPWLDTVPPNATVLVDPGPLAAAQRPMALAAALERADWVSLTQHEGAALTGESTPEAMARSLATDGRSVIVRLGAEGCLIVTSGVVEHVGGFAVEQVDANGAGDAHLGAFAAALSRGDGPVRAARCANAAAALSVTRAGPATSPTLAETQAFVGE
jgi:sugar/nucleoside kinase (ribokinase family)